VQTTTSLQTTTSVSTTTPPTTTTTLPTQKPVDGTSDVLLEAVVAGSIAFVLLGVVVTILVCKRRRGSNTPATATATKTATPVDTTIYASARDLPPDDAESHYESFVDLSQLEVSH